MYQLAQQRTMQYLPDGEDISLYIFRESRKFHKQNPDYINSGDLGYLTVTLLEFAPELLDKLPLPTNLEPINDYVSRLVNQLIEYNKIEQIKILLLLSLGPTKFNKFINQNEGKSTQFVIQRIKNELKKSKIFQSEYKNLLSERQMLQIQQIINQATLDWSHSRIGTYSMFGKRRQRF